MTGETEKQGAYVPERQVEVAKGACRDSTEVAEVQLPTWDNLGLRRLVELHGRGYPQVQNSCVLVGRPSTENDTWGYA